MVLQQRREVENCDVVEDSSDANEMETDVTDCHQSRNTPFRVKLVSVTMKQEEETWIRNEWGLRQCNTWGDEHCVLVSSVQHPRQKWKRCEKYDCEREREEEENFQLSSVHL